MKILLSSTLGIVAFALVGPAHAQSLKTQREKVGYALGAEIGATFKDKGVDFDLAAFNAGVRDAMTGNRPQLSASQRQELLMGLQKGGNAGAETQAPPVDNTALTKDRQDAIAFFAANRTKPGVQVTASGLQYKVLRDGTGAVPKAGDTVTVKYRGTLLNGNEFDNSDKHGDGTLTVAVSPDKVIVGWVEALKMMHAGAKWQLYVPSSLAYGDQAVGTDIGPGSALIFDVELLSVKK